MTPDRMPEPKGASRSSLEGETASRSQTHFGFETVPEDAKAARVADVFDSVARKYDVMNDLMSFGVHRLW